MLGLLLRDFFLCTDYTKEDSVLAMKKFTEIACNKKTNKKLPFGSAESRKKGGVDKLNLRFSNFYACGIPAQNVC